MDNILEEDLYAWNNIENGRAEVGRPMLETLKGYRIGSGSPVG